MVRVVFVAPFAADTTLRFVRSTAELADVRMALVSQEDPERFPAELRARLAGFRRVRDAMDAGELADAVRSLETELGGKAERLIGVLEQLQVPLAEVREALRIRGMDANEARNFRDKSRMKDVLRANGLLATGDSSAVDDAGPRLTWASVGLFRRELVEGLPPGTRAPLRPWLEHAIGLQRLGGSHWGGDWTDVGTPERLAALQSPQA